MLLPVVFVVRLLAGSAAGLDLQIGQDTITVSGITPGRDAVVLMIARRHLDSYVQLERDLRFETDADRDGVITISVPAGVLRKSIWAAVDEQTGRYAIKSPYSARFVAPAPSALGTSALALDRVAAEVLLVRPGSGTWNLTARSGGIGDEDAMTDTQINLSANGLRNARGQASRAEAFRPGDTLIVLDPDRMEFFGAVLTPAK